MVKLMTNHRQQQKRQTDIDLEHIRGKIDLLFQDFQTVSKNLDEFKKTFDTNLVEINKTLKLFNGVKEKVKYLEKWHWIVVVGIIVTFLISLFKR